MEPHTLSKVWRDYILTPHTCTRCGEPAHMLQSNGLRFALFPCVLLYHGSRFEEMIGRDPPGFM